MYRREINNRHASEEELRLRNLPINALRKARLEPRVRNLAARHQRRVDEECL